MIFKIEMDQNMVNRVITALAKGIYVEVAADIQNIATQHAEQLKAFEERTHQDGRPPSGEGKLKVVE